MNQSAENKKNAPLREKILAASAKLFSERGYSDTSIEDISTQVGCAKGSVYTYFRSKEQIFEEVSINGIRIVLERAVKALGAGKTIEEDLRLWANSVVDIFVRYFDLAAFIMSAAANGIDKTVLNRIHIEKDRCIREQAVYFAASPLFGDGCDYELKVNGFLGFAFQYTRAALSKGKPTNEIASQVSDAAISLFKSSDTL